MTQREFLEGWSVLTTALGFEISRAQQTLYGNVLADLPDGAFVAGIRRLVVSPEFSTYTQYKRLPTLHELREQCEVQAAGPQGEPHVGGVALAAYLWVVREDAGGPSPSPGEAADLVGRVAVRARGGPKKLLPGPRNMGHNALLRRAALVRVMPSQLSEDEWETRRRRLLEQADAEKAS